MKKGTVMYWKETNLPAYEKVGDKDWEWWSSMDPKELEKPLFRNDGTINRYGFKWTDHQILDFYLPICNFVEP